MRYVQRVEPLISALREDEIEAAVALWRACGLTRPWNDPHADARLALRDPQSTILAARDGDALIGTAMVGVDGHRGWVYYLAVDEAKQRTGLGRKLMEACEQWIRARGHPKIQLMVRTGNAAVIGFYETLGYERQDTVVLGKFFDGK